MSSYYGNYSQYLGAQRCCNLKTQGPVGPQGPTGPAAVGPPGTGPTGSTGSTGSTGPTGGAPWVPTNFGVGDTGYTGIGYTGDVMVFGKLYVEGGIDPTYLALEPQASGPVGFTNPLWVDTSGNLRSEQILVSQNTTDSATLTKNTLTFAANENATTISNTGIYDLNINASENININASENILCNSVNSIQLGDNVLSGTGYRFVLDVSKQYLTSNGGRMAGCIEITDTTGTDIQPYWNFISTDRNCDLQVPSVYTNPLALPNGEGWFCYILNYNGSTISVSSRGEKFMTPGFVSSSPIGLPAYTTARFTLTYIQGEYIWSVMIG
jgi:hypothetical protein